MLKFAALSNAAGIAEGLGHELDCCKEGRKLMKLRLTPRLAYLAGFLIAGGLILYALYLQYYEYQNPCPLCILQRVVYIALIVVFLVGALHGPGRTGAIVYSTLLVIVSL